ncbi:MAG: hotdog domain-containing protein [Acidimicrobiia bacterium]
MTSTYPPPHHAISDLALWTNHPTLERSVCVGELTDGIRNAAGHASLGYLCAAVDVSAAVVALIAGQPEWTATADLALHQASPITEGPVVVDSRLVRAGSNIVVVGVDVYDGEGRARDDVLDPAGLRLGAHSIVTFARIPRRASVAAGKFDPSANLGQWRNMQPADPASVHVPLAERIGLRIVDGAAGVVELDQTPYVSNSFGTINGGVLGMVFQGAAEAAHPGMVAVDAQIHYLAQSKVGPARTSLTRVRETQHHAVCSFDLVDVGNDGRLLSHAVVTLARA